jgi:hypothetical protein
MLSRVFLKKYAQPLRSTSICYIIDTPDELTDPDKGTYQYRREDSKSLLPGTYLMLDNK